MAIGALLALAATVSVTLSARLNDQSRLDQIADSTRLELIHAIDHLDAAARDMLAAPATTTPERALERLARSAEDGDIGRLTLRVEAVADLTRSGGALRATRLAARNGGEDVRADALARALADWPPGHDHDATALNAGDGAVWTVWTRREGAALTAALVRPTLAAQDGAARPSVSIRALPGGAAAAPSAAEDKGGVVALARFGDKVLAVRFTPIAVGSLGEALGDSAPFLILLALIAAAVVVMMRAQRANLALFDARQQEIIENIAANQRALEASEERFRHLAESTNVIPWTADLDRQRFTYVGPQIEDLSGYPASTWQASGFWLQHIHPADRQRVMGETLKHVEDGRYITVEYRIRAADGRTHFVRNMLAVTRLQRQGPSGPVAQTIAQGFMLDVTEMKRAEATLEEARAKAEEANRVKSEFLASMSHELRTPLNAVIGFSEIMKDEVFGPLDPRYREYAESVYASGRHLLDLINDVLDLSKIEAGRIELTEEPTDLGALMMNSRTLLQERMESAGVRCRADIAEDLPLVMVDERRIKQVLLNLMSNAIKFTPPGGTVTFIARHVPERGVLLAVRDTGIGMASDEIPKALSKFGQIDGELSRKHDGTGLGLPIAKSLIEMHGGTLEIDSEKGKGTEIRVWLPKSRLSRAA